MRYRWKLMLLLVVLALGPIVAMRTMAMRTMQEFREDLSAQTDRHLVELTEARLQLIADAYSLVLWKGREQVELALVAQANRVESLLSLDPPPGDDFHWADDGFTDKRHHPDDLLPSPFHFHTGRQGGLQFLEVSYSTQTFRTAPGVEPRTVSGDARRLAPMTETYRQVSRRLPETALWQSVSLASGLYSVYPGTDRFPQGFDPRAQEWYRRGISQPDAAWSAPFVDPATRQVVLAASRRIRRPGGETAGLTTIFVPVSSLLDHELLAKNIPADSRAFLCHLTEPAPGQPPAAFVLARDEHTDLRHRSWRTQIEPEFLTSSNPDAFSKMLKDVENERSSVRRMPFEGSDCLWAYGEARYGSFFLLVMPYDEIVAPIRRAETYVRGHLDRMVEATRYGLAGIVVLVVVLSFAFSKTVTRPLWALEEGVRQLAAGNFDVQVDIRSRDEFGVVGRVFNSVGPQLQESQRMRQVLEVAQEVQRNLLPRSAPTIAGLDVAARCIYCDQTGGDYYDFLQVLRDGEPVFGAVVGDVSDHGIPSALLMATVRAFLRQRAAMPGTPEQIMADVNVQLVRDVGSSGRFVTLFYTEFDTRRRSMSWVRAGHDPAWVYAADSDTFAELTGRGLPVGIFEDAHFEIRQRGFQKDEVYVIGTDGIWETRRSDGQRFGKERVREMVRRHARQSAQFIADAIVAEVVAYRQPLPREDDITLVVVKVVD